MLTNSDAHSLPRIGREVNLMRMEQVNFRELVLALKSESGRGILANYGVWPALGRYFRSYCESCDQSLSVHAALLSGGGRTEDGRPGEVLWRDEGGGRYGGVERKVAESSGESEQLSLF